MVVIITNIYESNGDSSNEPSDDVATKHPGQLKWPRERGTIQAQGKKKIREVGQMYIK